MNHDTKRDVEMLPPYTIENGSAPVVVHAAWLGAGDFCDACLVNDVYVFRFARHAAASAALRVECCLLPVLRQRLSIAVPAVEFAGRRADTGQAMMGYRLLPGEPLDRDVLDALPSRARDNLLAQIATFMRRLHDLPLQLISDCELPVLDPPIQLADALRRARQTLWPRLAPPAQQYYDDMLNLYLHEPALHRYEPAILHGDLSPDHVLVDAARSQITGIIDWGDAGIGDPASDFVYICEDYGAATLRRILAHYDRANAGLLERKVRILQQLNNVEYALSVLYGDDEELAEALALLREQAERDPIER